MERFNSAEKAAYVGMGKGIRGGVVERILLCFVLRGESGNIHHRIEEDDNSKCRHAKC